MSRVLVVGCGGIGGNVLGRLAEQPPEVVRAVGLTTNARIAEAVREVGLVLEGVTQPRTVAADMREQLDPGEVFDFVVLATQPPQVEAAAASVQQHLAEDGAMVVLQNGLCEERLAARVGPDRVIGGVVSWGASMREPGVYVRTAEGGFTLGQLGAPHPRLQELATLLEAVGPVSLTDNLAGARWSKLAINCAISTLGTIGGDRVGPLMRHVWVRRLALEVMTEVVDVAKAHGVTLEKVSGTLDLEWVALTGAERGATMGSPGLFAKHALLLGVGARYRNMRSSMLAAIERGRPPAVDFLNGEVLDRAREHGLDVPVNAAATALVHALARGERESSVQTLRGLFEETRGQSSRR